LGSNLRIGWNHRGVYHGFEQHLVFRRCPFLFDNRFDLAGQLYCANRCFLVVSILSLLVLRPLFHKYIRKNEIKTNADRLVGKIAVCTKAIADGDRGEVKIEGKIWTSISNENIAVGEKVEVLAIDGVKLVVKKSQ